MAHHDLITVYLHQLRGSLRWRPDADDLVDEAADHLHETTDRLTRTGTDPLAAQAQTLARFGDPALVARSFALTAQGGLAMPTPFTRATGTIGLATSALWLLTAATGFGIVLLLEWENVAYLVWATLAGLAALGTSLVLAGLLARSGGLRGWLPGAALLAAGAGALMLGVITWAWPLGTGLLTLAAALAVRRLHTSRTTTSGRDWLLAAAWPTGIAVFALLTWLQVGPVDFYGDYPVAFATGFATGAALASLGLFGLSRWLRGEPVPDTPAPLPAAAR